MWLWFKTSPARWLVYLLCAELLLAYIIPTNILSLVPALALMVDTISAFAPVINKIQPPYAPNPEPVKFYLAFTLLLFPLKVWFFYAWLNSDRVGLYQHLVVSSETEASPESPVDFVTEPMHQEKQTQTKQKPRSLFSRLFWSALILAISFGFMYALFVGVRPDMDTDTRITYYRYGAGGILMWAQWIVKNQLLSSFLLAVSFSVLRDYGITIFRTYTQLMNRKSS